MLSEKGQKAESPDEQVATISRRLSLRWKVLQVIGAVLIALSVMIEWPVPSDPALPATQSYLLVLGVLVFVTGLFGDRFRGLTHKPLK
jgi:hypothetical protein